MPIASNENLFLRMIDKKLAYDTLMLDELYSDNDYTTKWWLLLKDFYIFFRDSVPSCDLLLKDELNNAICLVEKMAQYQPTQMKDLTSMADDVVMSLNLPFDCVNAKYDKLMSECARLSCFDYNDIDTVKKFLLNLNSKLYCYLDSIDYRNCNNDNISLLFNNSDFIKKNILTYTNNFIPLVCDNVISLQESMRCSFYLAVSCVFDRFANLMQDEIVRCGAPLDMIPWENKAIVESLIGVRVLINSLDALYDNFENNFQGPDMIMICNKILSARERLAEFAEYYGNLCSLIMGVAWTKDLRAIDSSDIGAMKMKCRLYNENINSYRNVLLKLEDFDMNSLRSEIFDLNTQMISEIENGTVFPKYDRLSSILSDLDMKSLGLDRDLMVRIQDIAQDVSYNMDRSGINSSVSKVFIKDSLCIFSHFIELIDSINNIHNSCVVEMKSSLSKLVASVYKDCVNNLQVGALNMAECDRDVNWDIEFNRNFRNKGTRV